MFIGNILSGNWDKGWLEITGMPKDFILSARKLVVLEEKEYTEIAEAQKKPEPTKLQTDFIFEKMQNEIDHLKGERWNARTTSELLLRSGKELRAELKAKDALLKEKSIALANELDDRKAKDEEIVRLQPFERFYRHIYQHLKPGDEVICKICGKSMDQIEQSPER